MLSLQSSWNRILSRFGLPYRPRHHHACGPRLPRRAVLVHATAAGAAAGDPSDREALVKGDVGDPAQAQSIPGPATQLGQVRSATHLFPVWRVTGRAEAYVLALRPDARAAAGDLGALLVAGPCAERPLVLARLSHC